MLFLYGIVTLLVSNKQFYVPLRCRQFQQTKDQNMRMPISTEEAVINKQIDELREQMRILRKKSIIQYFYFILFLQKMIEKPISKYGKQIKNRIWKKRKD
jgi:hypothetical protein